MVSQHAGIPQRPPQAFHKVHPLFHLRIVWPMGQTSQPEARAKELEPGRQGHLFQIVVASKVNGAGQALAVCHVNWEPRGHWHAILAILDPC